MKPRTLVLIGLSLLLVVVIVWAFLKPTKQYDPVYFQQLAAIATADYQEQTAALGFPAPAIQKTCFPGVPNNWGPSPFQPKTDGGVLYCQVSGIVDMPATDKPSQAYYTSLTARITPVLRQEGFEIPRYADLYADRSGYVTIIDVSTSTTLKDACRMYVDYYTAAENDSGAPKLSYHFVCHQPAKSVPPGFTYDKSQQII